MSTLTIGRVAIGCLTAGLLAGLAVLSTYWTSLPQRWAAPPASAGSDALEWVWPPLVLALVAWTVVQVYRHSHGRARLWVAYPLLGVSTLGGLGAGHQTVREWIERRQHVPPGQLVDVGGRRLHLSCRGMGAPTVVLEAGLGETAAID